jgi:hypothetical protein
MLLDKCRVQDAILNYSESPSVLFETGSEGSGVNMATTSSYEQGSSWCSLQNTTYDARVTTENILITVFQCVSIMLNLSRCEKNI